MKERNSYKKRAIFHITKVLWHLDIFRRSFRELSGHACMGDSCIFCALKDLFGQLQFSHERALPPDALRKALAQSFSDQHRFQLGFMDDAAECFENILLRIHFHIAYNEAEDMCNAKHCIPHQKFAMTLVEQSVCGVCHATSEPLPFTQMVHYVSASALISQAKQMAGTSHPDLFGQLLKKAGGMGDIRDCPSSCGAKIQIRRTLINRPEIVSVGIVWDSDHPSLEHIMSLLDTLRIHLRLSDVFHGSFDGHPADNTYHQLVGVVTYYGKHYSTFFFHTKLRVWVYFDDANVREVGPHWENVVEKCRRGRYQPLLLLFATPNGTPVDACNAPKAVTLVDKPTMNVCSKPPIQRCSLSPIGSTAMGGRRSLTPSPEKSALCNDLTQRRAITPNPEPPVNQKPVNDYQNLVQFQETIFNRSNAVCDEQQLAHRQSLLDKHKLAPMRTELVRRDSGNWSGDRNSASSSSSTSLENPYHYIIGKMHLRNGTVPRSPNKSGDLSSGSGNSSGGPADPGYDSFSLSSTDSLPIQQNLKHNFQLAQIPEGHQPPSMNPYLIDENTRVADDCERLCAEVDQLLDRSERAEDLITALSLCNAAVNKARAAMDAPYSNPQTASFATMKHNACVLRARSLHRKLEEPLHNNLKYGESRHSREGSNSSARGSANSHSRQNSKDKGTHSRQNSQELLDLSALNRTSPTKSTTPDHMKTVREKLSPSKNIEIYATLPKNKKGLLSRSSPKTKNFVEDEEYIMKERPGRGLLGNRSKVASKKEVEKRARSEERNSKNVKEVVAAVVSKDKDREQKEAKKQSKQEEKQNKKQHKIRRKLLMGGLMRRKNRSMPDLREDEGASKETPKPAMKETSKDDSMVGSKTAIQSNLNGYLSEGNLEYAGNPNLERSKLMRKSFHGSKLLQFNKVPPPPPLRTTSQLSKNEQMLSNARKTETAVYSNHRSWCQEPASLPYISTNKFEKFEEENRKTDAITYSNGGFLLPHSTTLNTVVTEALIHHDASFQSLPPSIDEPDFVGKVEDMNFQLPPYPSPIHSNTHSRQASEEFPPPPVVLPTPEQSESSLLSMLQEKREKITSNGKMDVPEVERSGGETWLRELQAKQAERRKSTNPEHLTGNLQNVRDLKSQFEQMKVEEADYAPRALPSAGKSELQSNLKSSLANDTGEERKSGKKKNVTFCEQVVLVATADDEEADNYIPNPILERVLRTVLHKDSNTETKEHAVHSVVPLKRTDSWRLSQGLPLKCEEAKSAPPPRSQCGAEVAEKQIPATEDFDEVDGPCAAYSTSNQIQNNNVSPYINSSAYSPNYIPASSHCPPRAEYPEPASVNEQPNYNGNAETAYSDQYVNANIVGQTARKFNDSYQDGARYSPLCGRDAPPPAQNGYNPAYQPYQAAPPPSAYPPPISPSYQPMSLPYYPSQPRSSPQIQQYRDQNAPKPQPIPNGNCAPPPSLMRQNSNAAHYSRQLPPLDPRRLPVAGLPPNSMSTTTTRLSDSQRSQYYNGNAYSQRATGSSAYPPVSSGSTSYGYQNELCRSSINGLSQGRESPRSAPSGYVNGHGHGHESPRGILSGHNYGHESPRGSLSGHESPRGTLNGHGYGHESPRGTLVGNVHGQESSRSSLNGHAHPSVTGQCAPNYQVSSELNQSVGPQPNLNSSYPAHPTNGMVHNGSQASIVQPQQMQNHNSSYTPASSYSLPSQHTSSGPTSTGLHQSGQLNHHYANQYVNGSPQNQCVSSNTAPVAQQNIQNSLQTNHYPQNVSTSSVTTTTTTTMLPSTYQSVPQNSVAYNGNSSPYQQMPHPPMNGNANYPPVGGKFSGPNRGNLPPVYQHPPPPSNNNTKASVYQRVPTPNQQIRQDHNVSVASRHPSSYQHAPLPKQMAPLEAKKVNGVVPCNLCRKKQISPPSVYCTDCDFYISRFKQKA